MARSYDDLFDSLGARSAKYFPVRPSASEELARYTGVSAPFAGLRVNGRISATKGAKTGDGSSAEKAVLVIPGCRTVAATPLPSSRLASLEEVLFRGLIDTYLRGSTRGPDRASALYGSALWGIWHLPVALLALGILTIPITLPRRLLQPFV